jgi:tetratricopeptide (TPR) repeat protein
MTREDYLQRARRAFWNGEFEAAEAGYMAMISAHPADADGFGELGNLYQSMGKPQRALDAYYEAAVRLKASGEQERFRELVELLTREGDPRADTLSN